LPVVNMRDFHAGLTPPGDQVQFKIGDHLVEYNFDYRVTGDSVGGIIDFNSECIPFHIDRVVSGIRIGGENVRGYDQENQGGKILHVALNLKKGNTVNWLSKLILFGAL